MKSSKFKQDQLGLAELRRKLGFKQELMALYLKVNLSTMKLAELGLRTLPTYALVKVAELEIKLTGETPANMFTNIHPAEQIYPASFRQKYNDLVLKEKKCCYELQALASQLKAMAISYHKTRTGLQIIEEAMQENKEAELNAGDWKKQQELTVNALNKCGLPVQVILRAKADLLQAQVESIQQSRTLIMETVPDLFSEEK